jgi:hypothetical protein
MIPPAAASDNPGEPNRARKASCSIVEEITPESYPNRNDPSAAKAQQKVTRKKAIVHSTAQLYS